MRYVEWGADDEWRVGADLRRWWENSGRFTLVLGGAFWILLASVALAIGRGVDAGGAVVAFVVFSLFALVAALWTMAAQYLRRCRMEGALRLSPDSTAFFVEVRVRRQGVEIGSDSGVAWFDHGQFCFRGSRARFEFAARMVESSRRRKSYARSGFRWVLAGPVPRHELDVLVLDSADPFGSWSSVELFGGAFLSSSDEDAPDGTLPPRTFPSRGTLLDYLRAVHETGRPMRSFGYSLFLFGVIVWFVFSWGVLPSSIQLGGREVFEFAITSWVALFLASYPVGALWLPLVRLRVSRAARLDPVG